MTTGRRKIRKKPSGRKYRNLSARERDGAIYYERMWRGRRICFSTNTTDWIEAAAVRDLYEKKKGIGQSARIHVDPPRFEDFAPRYLAEDTDHLAPTSLYERTLALKPSGPLLPFFGPYRLDEVTKGIIRGCAPTARSPSSSRRGRSRGAKRGPKPKPLEQHRRHRVMLNLDDAEYQQLLDAARDDSASSYARHVLLRHLNRKLR